jgi:effector-binding domain-containing protein
MDYHVEVREIQPQPIACIRATTIPSEVGVTLTRNLSVVYGFLGRQQVTPSGPPVSVYDEFQPDRVVFAAGVPVARPIQGDGTVASGELPGGRVAVTHHVGPYDGLGAAHAAVRRWIADHGYTIVDPTWESYPMPHGGEPDPSKVVTELFYPIR